MNNINLPVDLTEVFPHLATKNLPNFYFLLFLQKKKKKKKTENASPFDSLKTIG